MRHTYSRPVAASALALLAAACGDNHSADTQTDSTSPSEPAQVVEIEMVDIAFEPTTIEVASGQAVRFAFTNTGAVPHDAFIGDAAAQEEHEMEMSDDSGMGHGGHDAEDALTVQPGGSGELEHTFDEPGTYEIGCHQPGHYEAGMKVEVTVT